MAETASLAELLLLEHTDDDVWTGGVDGMTLPQLYGGQLVGQSIMAAGASVEGKTVHSTHTTFLRGGDTTLPVSFHVERLRDGRTMSTREVSARQGDRLLCRTIVSCAVPSEGMSHSRPAPTGPGPDDCPTLAEVAEADGGLGEFWDGMNAIEVRLVPDTPGPVAHSAAPTNGVWMRSTTRLSDDPLLQQAALAYASDLMLMSTAVTPHGHVSGYERTLAKSWDPVSLDHTLWFRGAARVDEWLLFEHTTPMASSGRALIEAAVFDLSGDSVGHVAQEALFRPHA